MYVVKCKPMSGGNISAILLQKMPSLRKKILDKSTITIGVAMLTKRYFFYGLWRLGFSGSGDCLNELPFAPEYQKKGQSHIIKSDLGAVSVI